MCRFKRVAYWLGDLAVVKRIPIGLIFRTSMPTVPRCSRIACVVTQVGPSPPWICAPRLHIKSIFRVLLRRQVCGYMHTVALTWNCLLALPVMRPTWLTEQVCLVFDPTPVGIARIGANLVGVANGMHDRYESACQKRAKKFIHC